MLSRKIFAAISFALLMILTAPTAVRAENHGRPANIRAESHGRPASSRAESHGRPARIRAESRGGTVHSNRVPANSRAAHAHLTPANLIRVPLVRQSTDYTCGVAALQSILGFYGIDSREDELAAALKANSAEGTSYHEIAKYCLQHGFSVQIKKGMSKLELETYLGNGQPVLCLIQAWGDNPKNYATAWDDGHYVVAVGYDSESYYFMDPSTLGSYTYIPSRTFESRWHDTDGKERLFNFGMIISRKGAVFTPDVCKALE